MSVISTLWETEAGGLLEPRNSGLAWETWRDLISSKYEKNGRAWWRALIVPAAEEAETEGSLEPRTSKPQ